MKFNFLKNKEKLKTNTANLNSAINERTREKFILKEWIESSRKATCTKNGTRGFLFGSQTPSKMDFSLGRSMVEMLGVLAIIGVLSIGGIQGYTMAMRKYKANEILSALQKYAVSYYTSMHQKMLNDEVVVREDGVWTDKTTQRKLGELVSNRAVIDPEILDESYTFGIKSTNSGDFVLISLLTYNQALCETIINITGETAPGHGQSEMPQCMDIGGGEYVFYLSVLMN